MKKRNNYDLNTLLKIANFCDLPPFIVTHAKLELHDHKPLEPEVCIPKNCAAGIDCILYANTL